MQSAMHQPTPHLLQFKYCLRLCKTSKPPTPLTHPHTPHALEVIVSCSSAAFALAFDAGGSTRQQDVWVGGFTKDEAEQLAEKNGCGEDDWSKIQPIVAKCASPAFKPSFNSSAFSFVVVLDGTCFFN